MPALIREPVLRVHRHLPKLPPLAGILRTQTLKPLRHDEKLSPPQRNYNSSLQKAESHSTTTRQTAELLSEECSAQMFTTSFQEKNNSRQ
uniref:Uncharacterized protein n=1 Tax=Parascaris univalens TaxID=6257 RepID=A0A915ACR2_PARUN